MIPKKFRAARKDIENTIKNGLKVSSGFLYAKISSGDTEKSGFAIVVSKKNEPTSVGRHLIKRRISDVLEKKILKIKPDFKKTMIIFVQPSLNKENKQNKEGKKQFSYSQIKKDLEDILIKIKF